MPLSKSQPNLKVKHFEQSHGYCGPASLRILLSYFHRNISEHQIAQLCNATHGLGKGMGAEHDGLIQAVKEISGYVFTKEEGSVEEIEYFVKKEKLPVIIGWFDRDGDHYSVVVNVTPRNIIIVDPAIAAPERWLDRKLFPKIWFDFVGPDDKIVSWGWYLVVNFKKKHYPPIKGGLYF